MSTQALHRRLDRLARRATARQAPPLVLIDCTIFVDDQTFLEFTAADEDGRARMRADLAGYEEALVAQTMADGPETTDSRAIRAIIVTTKLQDEADVWRLTAEADAPSPDKQAALARRDAMVREAEAEWHREQAQKAPMSERDWNPSGPDEEVLYFEMPSGWPVTRAMHRARLEGLGG